MAAPVGYISGEESAAVHFVNAGDARPTTVPPRPYERGIHGQPTLVQNVESLAHVALIARFGDGWYRQAGHTETRGTAVLTVGGAVAGPGVREIQVGTPLGEVAALAGADRARTRAVLIGGYFGGWAGAAEAWELPLDPAVMRPRGFALGCGVVSFLSPAECGVTASARILEFMAAQHRRTVRSVRLRTASHRGCDPSPCGRPGPPGRPGARRTLVRRDRGPRSMPPP